MTTASRRAAVILAAGKGTRMRSGTAKVLHPFLGRPMIHQLVSAALDAGAAPVVVVVGHQAEAVEAAVRGAFDGAPVAFALQAEQRGTGHAVRCALEATRGADELLILSGDTPALDSATLRDVMKTHEDAGAALTVATMRLDDPARYGRVVRVGGDTTDIARIVEHADASADERAIDEVNAGLYVARRDALVGGLERLGFDNAQGELYLTDVVALTADAGQRVVAHVLPEPFRVAGINTRAQLAELEQIVLARRLQQLMTDGVTLHDPASVRIEAGVAVAPDVTLGRGVQLLGSTLVARGARIDAGCVLTNCAIGEGVHLKPYVVAEDARLAAGSVAGPFAHLRPGTALGRGAKVGNFVETKKALIGPGSKASHLSYLGDCELGADVNVGAGTITCNYDGVDKHKTIIEDGVFIGSDTQLVAPVTIGHHATIAAGTTVVSDVPAGALVLSRTPQKAIDRYWERRRKPREDAKRARKAAEAAARGTTEG